LAGEDTDTANQAVEHRVNSQEKAAPASDGGESPDVPANRAV